MKKLNHARLLMIVILSLVMLVVLAFNFIQVEETMAGKAVAGFFNSVCTTNADCDATKGFLCGLRQGKNGCEMAGSNPKGYACMQNDECQSGECNAGRCTAPATGCTAANQATTCPGKICGRSTLFDEVKSVVVPSVTICESSSRITSRRINYNFEVCLVHDECQSGLCGKSKAGYKECTKPYSEETGSVCAANKECRSSSCVSGLCAAPKLSTKVCGNGLVERIGSRPEQCDDWNLVNGDGCSSTCQVESSYTCSGSPSKCSNSCIKILDNGDPGTKINLLFVGHNYNNLGLSKEDFLTDVNELLYTNRQVPEGNVFGLFETEPFKSYLDRFNVYVLNEFPNEQEYCQEIMQGDYYADEWYSCLENNFYYIFAECNLPIIDNIEKYITTTIVAHNVNFPHMGLAAILTSSFHSPDNNYNEIIHTASDKEITLFLHEFGHRFGHFADYRTSTFRFEPSINSFETSIPVGGYPLGFTFWDWFLELVEARLVADRDYGIGCPNWCNSPPDPPQAMTAPTGIICTEYLTKNQCTENPECTWFPHPHPFFNASCLYTHNYGQYFTPSDDDNFCSESFREINIGNDCLPGRGCYFHGEDLGWRPYTACYEPHWSIMAPGDFFYYENARHPFGDNLTERYLINLIENYRTLD